jgi:hypothetical protein
MRSLHLCPDCLSDYKRSRQGKQARKTGGAWGRGLWPAILYHQQPTRKCARHHAQALADAAARRAGLERACPPWADRAAIKAVYAECVRLTEETGIPHEVDHEVPLNGRMVSGLHVHWNLKPIPAHINRRKSNHFMDG